MFLWINIVKPDRLQVTTWRWIPRATNRRSECVILIAFPLQRWFAGTHLSVTFIVRCLSCRYDEFTDLVKRRFDN